MRSACSCSGNGRASADCGAWTARTGRSKSISRPCAPTSSNAAVSMPAKRPPQEADLHRRRGRAQCPHLAHGQRPVPGAPRAPARRDVPAGSKIRGRRQPDRHRAPGADRGHPGHPDRGAARRHRWGGPGGFAARSHRRPALVPARARLRGHRGQDRAAVDRQFGGKDRGHGPAAETASQVAPSSHGLAAGRRRGSIAPHAGGRPPMREGDMTEAATLAKADSALKLRKLGVFLGSEVTGIELTRPVAPAIVTSIGAALASHEVLVFPRQTIGSDDLKRFGRYFGELTVHPFSTNAADSPELIVYDNKEGNPPAATDIWHSDETFRECPPLGTMLCAKIVPEIGGDTVFHSMTAAYESLSDRMQQFISGLEAVHDFKP